MNTSASKLIPVDLMPNFLDLLKTYGYDVLSIVFNSANQGFREVWYFGNVEHMSGVWRDELKRLQR